MSILRPRASLHRLRNFLVVLGFSATAALAQPADQNFDGQPLGHLGTSTTIDGVTYTTNDSAGIQVATDLYISSGPDHALYFDTSAGGTNLATFRSADGSKFKLNSFAFTIEAVISQTFTIKAYRESFEVATANVGPGTYHDGQFNVSSNASWENIDEVRITGTSYFVLEIDDLDFSPAVVPNSAPTLSATAVNPSFTEDSAAVDLYSAVAISAHDAGQTITHIILTVANLADASDELLLAGGTQFPLTNGTAGTTSVHAVSYSVSVAGSTATVTLSNAVGLSTANAQSLIDGITYRNSSDSPTAGSRVITLTSITDSGGTAGGGVDTTSLSVASTVTVSGVNDAPGLGGGPYALTGTDENTASSATLVSTILGGVIYYDVDASPASGVAVTAAAGNGTWQYSTDNVTWNGVGSVAGAAALLLSSSTSVRYIPDGANGETATLTFRAWDQTSGTASTNSTRHTADTTTNGGTTAFSSGTAQATITIAAVNDAPVLTPASPTLSGITDSDTSNAGQTVASVVGASIADVDAGAIAGIALHSLDSGNGTWQYSLNGGANWANVGTVSAGASLLLRTTDYIRFVPNGINGTTATFAYRAWDQTGATAGQQGTHVDITTNGGSTPFSANTDTASITVTSVNDAPVLAASGGTTAFTESGSGASTPVAIDAALTVADSDSATLATATVSITANFQSGQDVLAFTNNGSSHGNITASYNATTGVLTLTSAGATASLAQWQAALRSVTYTNSSDAPSTNTRTVSFAANDGAADSNAATKSVSVASTNDAPQVTAPASIAITEDVATALTGISFADADAASSSVTVTFAVPSGTLSATSGGGVIVGGTATSLTLTGSTANVNAFIAGSNLIFTTAGNATANVTLTVGIDDGGNTGAGGALTDSESVTLTVTAVNDAPTITAPASIAVTEDVPAALTGISFADVDIGSGTATATLSVPSGTLHATSGSGVTVSGSGTGSLTLSGSLADVNAFLAASNVNFTTASNATANVTLSVTISDGGNTGSGGTQNAGTTITLAVTAVNDAPVNTLPAAQSVNQDATLVLSSGTANQISVADVDAGSAVIRITLTATNGTVTLSGTTGLFFITGDGTSDPTLTLEGTSTDLNNALNGLTFTPASGYSGPASLQIATNDLGNTGSGGNQTDTDTLAITVSPIHPTIASVSSPTPDGGYKAGETLALTVTFTQGVTVNTAGGSPTLLLETGAADRNATYVSGSGTSTLTFSYTVQAGDSSADLDYQSTGALALNGATIRNASSQDAVLTLPTVGGASSIAGQKNLVIDGIAPTVTNVSVPANGTYVAGQNLDFTVAFSEAVTVNTGGGTPRLPLTLNTGGTAYAQYLSGSGSSAVVFRHTVSSGQADPDGITVAAALDLNGGTMADAVGNNAALTLNSVGSTAAVRVDAIAPIASGITRASPSPTAGPTAVYTVTFAEAVTGVDAADFTLVTSGSATAHLASVTPVSTSAYSVNLDGITGSGTVRLDLNGSGTGIQDTAGNSLVSGLAGESFAISRAGLPLAGPAGASGTYGAPFAPVAIQATSSTLGFNAVSLPPGLTFHAGIISGTPRQAGTFTVRVTAIDAQGNVSSLEFPITIAPAALTVTADLKSRAFGAANPAFTATFSGFVNGDTTATAGLTGAPTFSTAASADTLPGTAAITVAAGTLASDNYTFASFVPGTLTIERSPQTITLRPSPAAVHRSPLAVIATSTSGLPVSLSVPAGPAVIEGSSVTLTADAGPSATVIVRATQPGDARYAPAELEVAITLDRNAGRKDRLVNLSSRARIGPSPNRTLITGFVVSGTTTKRVLLRAIGPTLAGFGVSDAIPNPRVQIYNTDGQLLHENDDWSGTGIAEATAAAGGFALPAGSRDAALLLTLAPGAYTMHVIDGGDTGIALAEIYDLSEQSGDLYQRLVNISSRGTVDPGDGMLFGGFVITGETPKRVLIRGVGPALGTFGVTGALADPRLSIYSGTTLVAQNDDWATPLPAASGGLAASATEIVSAGQATGAFAFASDSKDAAVVVSLLPGAYTAQVATGDGTSGVALVEIYELP